MDRSEVFEKLLWFFRLDERSCFVNLNTNVVATDHYVKEACDFLADLCEIAWRANSPRWAEEARNRLKAAQPRLVNILFGLQRIDLLVKKDWRVDAACLKQIKKLVLNPENYRYASFKPTTVEEVAFSDNAGARNAAQTLLLLEIRERVMERRAEISRLESQRREADAKLAELQGKKSGS